jgi:hypothetical protein
MLLARRLRQRMLAAICIQSIFRVHLRRKQVPIFLTAPAFHVQSPGFIGDSGIIIPDLLQKQRNSFLLNSHFNASARMIEKKKDIISSQQADKYLNPKPNQIKMAQGIQ